MKSISEFTDSLNKNSTSAKNSMIYDTRRLPLASMVRFTGNTRALSKAKKNICIQSTSAEKEVIEIHQAYDDEVQVQDGKRLFWIPIQRQVLPHLKTEIKTGQQFIIFVRYLGSCHLQEIEHVFLMIDFNSGSKASYFNALGLELLEQRSLDQAISAFNSAIHEDPVNTSSLYNRSKAYFLSGKFEMSIIDLTSLLKATPDDSEAYFDRALAYQNYGKNNEALADYEKGFSKTPDFARGYLNRALLFRQSGKLEESEKDFAKAEQLEPANPNIYCERAKLYKMTNQSAKAENDQLKCDKMSSKERK